MPIMGFGRLVLGQIGSFNISSSHQGWAGRLDNPTICGEPPLSSCGAVVFLELLFMRHNI